VTRTTLRRTLRRIYALLIIVLGVSFFAKTADHIPFLAGTGAEKVLKDAYEFLRDMSLLIATGGVAYIANVYQKRSSFIAALKEEWCDIIATKSALLAYTHIEHPTQEQYIHAFCKISETIDNMRSVYRNVGETTDHIGLYPFEPLHDMRRILQTLHPRNAAPLGAETRSVARDAIVRCFNGIRETFLEELDLEEPATPLLTTGARRSKRLGALQRAHKTEQSQRAFLDRVSPPHPIIDPWLAELRQQELAGTVASTPSNMARVAGAATPEGAGRAALASDPAR
jgi:hypothetical protein